MKITICNFKGGVGKSLIAHQLITGHGFYGIELDPYGSLSKRLPDKVTQVSLKTKALPKFIDSGSVIFDCGGFDDHKLIQAIDQSHLILIPFIPTLESIHGTLLTLKSLSLGKPFLFVSNMGQKPDDIRDAILVFEEALRSEVDCFILPLSVALQTAVNENKSVHELASSVGIRGFAYQKASQYIRELYNKIQYFNK